MYPFQKKKKGKIFRTNFPTGFYRLVNKKGKSSPLYHSNPKAFLIAVADILGQCEPMSVAPTPKRFPTILEFLRLFSFLHSEHSPIP
ncbi:Hypothetical protein NTJ_11061 [Nesidiocoris tenuis]|uniref:Uncharacterized protein n=1 Tax=Nesidiocoris tenuis TaxID=355587 RepID=A0ABN7B1E7_9HEMI|nr:Hypothetical protein NTJ_11061 [Nesidiocoris tenuis]